MLDDGLLMLARPRQKSRLQGPKLAAQGGPRFEVLQQPNRSLIAALQSCSSPTEG